MDRDPGELAAGMPPKAIADLSDGDFDAWAASALSASGLRSTDEADVASEARALADFEAGRFHRHAVVYRWLRTWGTPGQMPFKDWFAAQNG